MKNLNFLKNFLTITKFRSLAEYVDATGNAHAYATHTIKEIEKEFGCQVVERFRKRIQLELTPAGAHLVRKAPSVIAALEDLKKSTQFISTPQLPITFNMYVSRALSAQVIAKNLPLIHNAVPEVKLHIYPRDLYMSYDEKIGNLTLGAYTPTSANDMFVQHHVIDYSVNLWASNNYIKQHGIPSSVADLKDHTFIAHNSDALILKTLKRYRAYHSENITIIDTPSGVIAAANSGGGLVFVNNSVRKFLGGDGGQVVLPELNYPASLYFSYPVAWQNTDFMQELCKTVTSVVHTAFQE